MLLVYGFLGCLRIGHAFKRSSSTSSFSGEQPGNAHHLGDRHHGDRHGRSGRNGRGASHNGMASVGNSAGASGSSSGAPSDNDPRAVAGVSYGGPSGLSQFDGDVQAGAAAAAAAIAAATQPAQLVKFDRAGASRRTPLHLAAERGQLHVLSAIIENLCCSATATLLDGPSPGPGPGSSSSGGEGAGGGAGSLGDASSGPEEGGGGGRRRPQSQSQVGGGGGSSRPRRAGSDGELQPQGQQQSHQRNHHHRHHHRHHHNQQQQHRQQAPGAGGENGAGGEERLTSRSQQQQRGGAGSGGAEEFAASRPGPGVAPMAPEQFIHFHLNMQDADGTTALSLACRFGHVDCCRLLLANGSARTLSDARGNMPLHYAALRGHLGVLFMLLDEFVEPGQQEELAGYVDARNHAGCTPLHYAVWGRQSGSVQVLLQHGADVLPRNTLPAQELTPPVMVVGSTPLHLAAARGHVEICRIILKTFAERVLEPLQLTEDDPQPPMLASLDPRVQVNANGHMPYQVAQRLGFYPLAMLLRPSIPILRLFSEEERAVRFYGPAPLRAIAAEALNKKLLSELDALAAAAAAAAAGAGSGGRSAAGAGGAVAAPAAAAAATAASGDAAGARRPVSAPATLEQLAAASVGDEDEEDRHGELGNAVSGALGTQGTQGTSDGERRSSSTAAAAAGGSSPVRQLAPPRPLQLGATDESTAASSSTGPGAATSPQLGPSVGPSRGGGGGLVVVPPRTPPGASLGIAPLSPGGISPRLVSPISLGPGSPSTSQLSPTAAIINGRSPSPPSQRTVAAAAAGFHFGSPTANRVSSGHRPSPPLSSQRSSNAMMPAAPMVAALSRPPSAPRANGQQSSSPRTQILLSLPGQPDTPELQPLPPAARELVVAAEVTTAATDVGGGDVAGGDAGPGASGSPGGAYGPRTPVRQPSAGTLHVRRVPVSPSGAAGAGGGSAPVAVEGLRRSGDGGRPPGLVRLRSNPLFEDSGHGRSVGGSAINSASGAGADGGGAAAVGPSGGGRNSGSGGAAMPPLAEDLAEGEDGSTSESAATVASSCAVVVPLERSQGTISSRSDSEPSSAGTSGRPGPSEPPAPPAPSQANDAADVRGRCAGGGAATAVLSYPDDDEELECGVCMEPLPMVAIAPCRHQVCGPCARRICCLNIQKPSHCPFCRATISAFVAPPPTAQQPA